MLAIYDNNRDDDLHSIEFILVDDAKQAQTIEEVTQYRLLVIAYKYSNFEHFDTIAQYFKPNPDSSYDINQILSLISTTDLINYFKKDRTKKDFKMLMTKLQKMGLMNEVING